MLNNMLMKALLLKAVKIYYKEGKNKNGRSSICHT